MKNFRTRICATPLILTSMMKKKTLLFVYSSFHSPLPLTFTTHTTVWLGEHGLQGNKKIQHSRNSRQTMTKILIVYFVNIINDAIKRIQINPQSIIKLKLSSKVETYSSNQIISKTLWDRLSRAFWLLLLFRYNLCQIYSCWLNTNFSRNHFITV